MTDRPTRRSTDNIDSDIKAFVHDELSDHEVRERKHIDDLIDSVLKAFPDGVDNHRLYHAAKINAAKAEEEFWKVAKLEIVKKGITGIVGLIGILLVLAALGLSVKLGLPIAWGMK